MSKRPTGARRPPGYYWLIIKGEEPKVVRVDNEGAIWLAGNDCAFSLAGEPPLEGWDWLDPLQGRLDGPLQPPV